MEANRPHKIIFFFVSFVIFMNLISQANTNVAFAQGVFTWGSRGENVTKIQERLISLGYLTDPQDGIFGHKTLEAVKSFHKKNKLVVDGIVGKKTLEALDLTLEIEENLTTVANTREQNLWLLACLINGEGRGEPYLGQVAIGAVVMNRVRSPEFPNSISGVIYQPGAFDVVYDGQIKLTPSESCINAARDAMNGWDPVNGAEYYWNPETATSKWVQTLTITKQIENHVFAMK